MNKVNSPINDFKAGVKKAIPIMIGYLPIAISFGILSKQSNLHMYQALLMSVTVFAGASQFMAANMLFMGASGAEIILATFILNFRHFIMSMSLMDRLKDIPLHWKAFLSFGITDETFAVASADYVILGSIIVVMFLRTYFGI